MNLEAEVGGRTLVLSVRARNGGYEVDLDGRRLVVEALRDGAFLSLVVDGRRHETGLAVVASQTLVTLSGDVLVVELREASRVGDGAPRRAPTGPTTVKAPMPGKVVRVLVAAGDTVAAGAGLLVVEAMKMENELRAPRAGVVLELLAREGQAVESGALLAVVG